MSALTSQYYTRALKYRDCETPLVRADVDSTCCAEYHVSPREARRPLRVTFPSLPEKSAKALRVQLRLEALGKYVGKLIRRIHTHQTQMAMLDNLVRKMLANVDMLSTLTTADDMIAPLDACIVVLINWCPGLRRKSHLLQQLTQVDYFYSCQRCRVVFRLCRRESNSLLQFRLPMNWSAAVTKHVSGRRPTRIAVTPVRVTESIKTDDRGRVLTIVQPELGP